MERVSVRHALANPAFVLRRKRCQTIYTTVMVKMPGTPFQIGVFAFEIADRCPCSRAFRIAFDPAQGYLRRRTFPGPAPTNKYKGRAPPGVPRYQGSGTPKAHIQLVRVID